jgi:ABC-2 type transport system ATP-binding protein
MIAAGPLGGTFGGDRHIVVIVVGALLLLRLLFALRRRRRTSDEPEQAATNSRLPRPTRPLPVSTVDVTTESARDGRDVLVVRNLTVTYGATRAVDDLGFSISRGEIFGLLGPNGAGKTSTLSAIEGLLRPHTGRVLVDGIDVRAHPGASRARLGVQLQTTGFQPELTIRQIVQLYAGLYGVQLSEAAIAERLSAIGLQAHAKRQLRQLSGGQQQRLSLLIALIHNPVLLLLDEPTTGLDPQSRRQLWRRIERIRGDGASVLLTTHSMEEAQAVCDRVAIIDQGSLLAVGPPRDLILAYREDPLVRAAAHGDVTLEDVFIGLTGGEIRD